MFFQIKKVRERNQEKKFVTDIPRKRFTGSVPESSAILLQVCGQFSILNYKVILFLQLPVPYKF